jgi:DNA-directed RNA polymerase subunit RPC12/RpoP
MEKIIVKCKKCNKQMKIINKNGKYRCPYCKEIYKLNVFNRGFLKIGRVFGGFLKTLKDIKNTFKYRLMVAKNMKNNRKNYK